MFQRVPAWAPLKSTLKWEVPLTSHHSALPWEAQESHSFLSSPAAEKRNWFFWPYFHILKNGFPRAPQRTEMEKISFIFYHVTQRLIMHWQQILVEHLVHSRLRASHRGGRGDMHVVSALRRAFRKPALWWRKHLGKGAKETVGRGDAGRENSLCKDTEGGVVHDGERWSLKGKNRGQLKKEHGRD